MSTAAYTLLDGQELVDALSWRIDVRQVTGLSVEDRLVSALDDEIPTLSAGSGSVPRMFRTLSGPTKRGLIRHPYIAGHLRNDFRMSVEQLALFVGRLVLSNLEVNDEMLSTTEVRYEADGQLQLISGECGGTVQHTPFRCVFSNDDYVPLLDNGREFTSSLGVDAAANTLRKLQIALHGLSTTSSHASQFVNSYIWNLALRENVLEKGTFSSRSFQCLPGLALFCNPSSKRASSFAIEEALVHESIHSFLFFAESPNARLLANQRDYELKVTSPWSGSVLDLHTGIHALLVWLGLANYWRLAIHQSGEPEKREFATGRLAFIENGFQSSGFPSFIKTICERTAAEFRVVIESMLDQNVSMQSHLADVPSVDLGDDGVGGCAPDEGLDRHCRPRCNLGWLG